MTEHKPRPPRQRPSRTGRSVAPVEPGRCHLYGAPAGDPCPHCHRPVCDAHRVSLPDDLQPLFGPEACADCARFAAGDLARDEGQWARKRDRDQPYRTCALCGRELEQVLPRCSRCGRHLCPEHAIRYRKPFRFGAKDGPGAAWYWDTEVRCLDHQLNPLLAWLKRWHRLPADHE